MANALVKIYKDNPTAGATDGVEVSDDWSFSAPISCTVDAEKNGYIITKCAIRTSSAEYVASEVTISVADDDRDKFSLCKTLGGIFASSISLDEVHNTNVIFYVKASATSTEQLQRNFRQFNYSGKLRRIQS